MQKRWLLVIFCILSVMLLSCSTENGSNVDPRNGGPDDTTVTSTGNEFDTIPVIFSVHMESRSSRVCDNTGADCATDEEWEDNMGKLDRLIDAYEAAGMKGTFQHQSHWLTRLQDSEQGLAIIGKMIDGGHEIALHRHGFTHNSWDGYSDDLDAAGDPEYIGPISDLMDIIYDFEEAYGIEITTVEGTDLMVDRQDEWIFQTGDDGNNQYAYELPDPDGLCPVGRPAWSSVALPNTLAGAGNVLTIPHTHYGPQDSDCAEYIAEVYLDRIDEIIVDGTTSTQALNFVLHPTDFGRNDENEAVYSAFFLALGNREELQGMTVQEFMCERAGECV